MSALSNQLGIKAESTYGTRVVVNRFHEFTADSMKKVLPRIMAAGHRPGDEAVRFDHWMNGRAYAAGGLEFEVANKSMGLWWDMALGTTTSASDGAGFIYTTKLGDQLGKSLTIQKGLGDTGGPTVDPIEYTGCKVTELSFTQALDAYLKMAVVIDAQAESTAQTLATATAPTVTELFHWDQLAVTVGGVSTKVTQLDCHIKTPMQTNRYFAGSTTKSEPIRNGKRDIGGTLVCEFESVTNYNTAVAQLSTGSSTVIVATWTGVTTYDTAKPFKLVITFNQCRLDPDTPVANAEDVIPFTLPFVAMGGASETVTIAYYTSDAAI